MSRKNVDMGQCNEIFLTKSNLFETFEEKQIYTSFKRREIEKQQQQPRTKSMEEFRMLPPEEQQFYLVDQDSGVIIDTRDSSTREIQERHSSFNLKLEHQESWEGYWEESKHKKQQLFNAVENGDENLIQELFKEQQTYYLDVNAQDPDRWTALHIACNENFINICQLLIDLKADVNAVAALGFTPLMIASKRGHLEICQLLVSKGARLDATDKCLNTPLHFAVQSNHIQLIEFLINSGADLQFRNKYQQLPIDFTADPETQLKLMSLGYKKEQLGYGEVKMGQSQKIQPTSRSDHIFKFISRSNTVQNIKIFFKGDSQQKEKNKFKYLEQKFQMHKVVKNEKYERVGPESFQIIKELGRGAFGSVFLVKLKETQEQFAVKIIKKQNILKNNLIRYVMAEKETMRIVKHPFIVNLNWTFQTKNHLMLVMDYCPGGDLSKLLDQKICLSEQLAKVYVAEITLALECLHQNLIIYRDLKPDNIVIDAEGHALLTDFGLSKMGMTDGLVSKSFCGSPAYMAPEIIDHKGHFRTVDWYLLGVVTYEMLTGQPPYYDSDKAQLYRNIVGGVLKLPKKISHQATDFIVKLLDRNPNTRLGVKEDADEIKSHPWLSDIDWEKCYKRNLTLPKPKIKSIDLYPQNMTIADLIKDEASTPDNIDHILGWSYDKNFQMN